MYLLCNFGENNRVLQGFARVSEDFKTLSTEWGIEDTIKVRKETWSGQVEPNISAI